MIRKLIHGLVIASALIAVGCGGNGSSNNNVSATAPVTTGVVGNLTNDPDDEVSPELQTLVEEALKRGDEDEPLEFQDP